MQKINFPFTAIIGHSKMKIALILNVIDPLIGGVLLSGHRGTGKSTAVRSLIDVMPELQVIKDCPFNCNPDSNIEDLCEICVERVKSKNFKVETRQMKIVNLPLGVTEDMVCGSLDIERVLAEGIRSLHAGLLAKAHRGILYIDEVNLLQDHIVDTLLDASASGINIVEREGISVMHPSRFILIGSMNPEEGDLRPQIADRFGLEVKIEAPEDPKIRAEITKRVIKFDDNPKEFIKQYQKDQDQLKQRIIQARKILKDVKVSDLIYKFVSEVVSELGIFSQRADISFIRCARTNAAFNNRIQILNEDLEVALDLVFEHRMESMDSAITAKEIKGKIIDAYGKIKEAYENLDIYKPNEETEGPLKSTDEAQEQFKRQSVDKNKINLPETKEQKLPPPKEEDKNQKYDPAGGWKVKKLPENEFLKNKEKDLINFKEFVYKLEKKITSILDNIRNTKKLSNFGGRGVGNRTKFTSTKKGHYISYRRPLDYPKNIALDASIRSYLKNLTYNPTNIEFPLKLDKTDIMERVYEFKAPLALFFILDASASMYSVMKQMTNVIEALQREGYKKKDKIAIIMFRGKDAIVIQKPTLALRTALSKVKNIEGKSYTPMSTALHKVLSMINIEKMRNRNIYPVLFICSDCGANISYTYPDLVAQVEADYNLIVGELKDIAKTIAKRKIKVVILEPRKSWATRNLGIHPFSAEEIKKNFKLYCKADVFKFNEIDPNETILKLKRVL
jgi:Mg-chelatase subunit ChlI/Mg-chelatase subunit ChlD